MKRLFLLVFTLICVANLSGCSGQRANHSVMMPQQPSGFLIKKDDPYVPLNSSDFSKLPTELEPVYKEILTLNPVIKRSSGRNPGEARVLTPAEFSVSLILKSAETDIMTCESFSEGNIKSQCRSFEYKAVRDFVMMMRDKHISPYLKQAVIDDLKSDHYLNLFNTSRLSYEVAKRCQRKHQKGYVRLYWHAVPCNGRGEKLSFMDARRKKVIN